MNVEEVNLQNVQPLNHAEVSHGAVADAQLSWPAVDQETTPSDQSSAKPAEQSRPKLTAKRSQNSFLAKLSKPVVIQSPAKAPEDAAPAPQVAASRIASEKGFNNEDTSYTWSPEPNPRSVRATLSTVSQPSQNSEHGALWEDARSTWTWIDDENKPLREVPSNAEPGQQTPKSSEKAATRPQGQHNLAESGTPTAAPGTDRTLRDTADGHSHETSTLVSDERSQAILNHPNSTETTQKSGYAEVIDLTDEKHDQPPELHIAATHAPKPLDTRPSLERSSVKDTPELSTHPSTPGQVLDSLGATPTQTLLASSVGVTACTSTSVNSTETLGQDRQDASARETSPMRKARVTPATPPIRVFDSDAFDQMIYQQSAILPPPEGLRILRGASSKDLAANDSGRMFLGTNPSVHRMHNHNEEWFRNKATEIKLRGGRKFWFGKAVERERWRHSKDSAAVVTRKDPKVWSYRRPVDFGDVALKDLPDEVRDNPAWEKACAWHRQSPDLHTLREKALQQSKQATEDIWKKIQNERKRQSSESIAESEAPKQSRRRTGRH